MSPKRLKSKERSGCAFGGPRHGLSSRCPEVGQQGAICDQVAPRAGRLDSFGKELSRNTHKIFPAEAGRSERRVRRGWSEPAADLEDPAPETVVGSVDESGVHRVEGVRACDRTLLSGKISLGIEARMLKAEARGIFVADLSAIAEIPFIAVVADV